MPYRINTLGASGSGATTVARAVADALSLPCFDSDDYYHGPSDPPFQNPRHPAERSAMLKKDLLRTADWVLGGGIAGWEPCPELDFTLIGFVSTPTDVRIQRLRYREHERFGARVQRGGNMYQAHEEFIDWASRYDVGGIEGKTRQRHETWLAQQSCAIVRLDGLLPVRQLVQIVLAVARPGPRG